MAELASWPSVTNDAGDKQTGTIWSKAVHDGIKTSVEDNVHSAANPTVKTKAIIDEVVLARGSKGSLDARLDVALEEDGTPKAVAGQASQSDVAALVGSVNLVQNDILLIWAAGDTSAPTGYVLAGGGGTVARTGTGLGDTKRKVGSFAVKVTRSGTDVTLTQTLLDAAAFPRADHLEGLYVLFGAWVWADSGTVARLSVRDGSVNSFSSYHTGNSTWQFLRVAHLVDGGATQLAVVAEVNTSNNSAYFSGLTAILADDDNVALTGWRPTPITENTVGWLAKGTQAAGNGKGWYGFDQPAIVTHIECNLRTAPTGGTTFKVDVNRGGTTMLGTVIAFTASDKNAGRAPDGTYSQRCFPGNTLESGTTITDELTYDIDAVGSTIAGADLIVKARFLQFVDSLAGFKSY